MTSEDQLSLAEAISASVVTGLKAVLQPLVSTNTAEGNATATEHAETETVQEEWLQEIDQLMLETVKNPPPNKIVKGRRTTTYINGVDERIKQLQDLRNDRINYRSGGKPIR